MDTISKNSTARNRRWRQGVKDLGYARLEVFADMTTIKQLRAVAKARKIAGYEALEQAVRLLVDWHNADVAGNGKAKSAR